MSDDINAMVRRLIRVRNAEKTIDQLKSELTERLTENIFQLLMNSPGCAMQGIASDLYWADKSMAKIVGDAWMRIGGAKFKPTPIVVKKQCQVCGEGCFPTLGKSYGSLLHTLVLCDVHLREHIQQQREKDAQKQKARDESRALKEQQRTSQPQIAVFPGQPDVSILKSMPYSDYLKTTHWDTIRLAALKRAGYRCQICNTGNTTLDVHHRTYERRGSELPTDLTVLCRACHEKFHDIVPMEVRA